MMENKKASKSAENVKMCVFLPPGRISLETQMTLFMIMEFFSHIPILCEFEAKKSAVYTFFIQRERVEELTRKCLAIKGVEKVEVSG